MADTKISALPASTTPLAGTEVLPIVQSGATKKVSIADLTAGRAPSVSGLTVTGLTASTALALNASKEIVSVTNTGTGDNVLQTAPTLVGDVTLSTGNLIIGALNKGLNLPFAAIKSSSTSGDFTITVSGLSNLSGSVWRKSSMLVYYSGIDGAITNATDLLTVVELGGLSTYGAGVGTNIVGTAVITTANPTNNSIDVTFDVSNSNAGSVMVFLLGGAEGSAPQISITP